jgi:hypothetical protein
MPGKKPTIKRDPKAKREPSVPRKKITAQPKDDKPRFSLRSLLPFGKRSEETPAAPAPEVPTTQDAAQTQQPSAGDNAPRSDLTVRGAAGTPPRRSQPRSADPNTSVPPRSKSADDDDEESLEQQLENETGDKPKRRRREPRVRGAGARPGRALKIIGLLIFVLGIAGCVFLQLHGVKPGEGGAGWAQSQELLAAVRQLDDTTSKVNDSAPPLKEQVAAIKDKLKSRDRKDELQTKLDSTSESATKKGWTSYLQGLVRKCTADEKEDKQTLEATIAALQDPGDLKKILGDGLKLAGGLLKVDASTWASDVKDKTAATDRIKDVRGKLNAELIKALPAIMADMGQSSVTRARHIALQGLCLFLALMGLMLFLAGWLRGAQGLSEVDPTVATKGAEAAMRQELLWLREPALAACTQLAEDEWKRLRKLADELPGKSFGGGAGQDYHARARKALESAIPSVNMAIQNCRQAMQRHEEILDLPFPDADTVAEGLRNAIPDRPLQKLPSGGGDPSRRLDSVKELPAKILGPSSLNSLPPRIAAAIQQAYVDPQHPLGGDADDERLLQIAAFPERVIGAYLDEVRQQAESVEKELRTSAAGRTDAKEIYLEWVSNHLVAWLEPVKHVHQAIRDVNTGLENRTSEGVPDLRKRLADLDSSFGSIINKVQSECGISALGYDSGLVGEMYDTLSAEVKRAFEVYPESSDKPEGSIVRVSKDAYLMQQQVVAKGALQQARRTETVTQPGALL